MEKKTLTLEDRKRIALDCLDEIQRVCGLIDTGFYLAYGTLLGAIRHKGFIPWDDDVDIWMFRDDFEVFLSNFNKLCKPGFKLLWHDSSSDYPYLMPKVVATNTHVREKCYKWRDDLGVFIDVFVLDGVPDVDAFPVRSLEALEHRRWMSLYKQSVPSTKLKLLLFNLICQDTKLSDINIKPERFTKQIFDICNCPDRADFLMSPTSSNSFHLFYPSACWDEVLMLPYEDRLYPVPAGYDEILKKVYGDYMTPPPERKRKAAKHIRCAYIQ